MSLRCPVGPESNLLEPEEELEARLILEQPVLSMVDIEVLYFCIFQKCDKVHSLFSSKKKFLIFQVLKRTTYRGWKTKVIDIVYPVNHDAKVLNN